MDALDASILRAMSREQVLWWGSLDPRLCAEALAKDLHVDPGTVRARLRRWERDGFLLGFEVVPNVRLFGARMGGGTLRVDDPRAKEGVLRALDLVDGVLVVADNVGPWMAIHVAHESPAALARREAAVRRIPGVDELEPCIPHDAPACSAKATALDWRILQALRVAARDPLAAAASRAGVSVKTFRRRYEALVAGGAVWSIPVLDFTRWSGAVLARFLVGLVEDAKPGEVAREVRRLRPDLLQIATPSELGLGLPYRIVDASMSLASAGEVEEVTRSLLDIKGVAGVEVVHPRRFHVYGHWFDERIAERLGAEAVG